MALAAQSEPEPIPDGDALRLIRDLFTDARRHKRRLIPRWNSYYRAIRNTNWADTRAKWLPSPQSSEIFPTIHSLVAWMTDSQPRLFASPQPSIDEFTTPPAKEKVVEMAGQMQRVLESAWVTGGFNPQVEMCLWDTFTYGAGILKTGWDPAIRDGEGDIVLRRVDPYSILPDPQASSIDDARYIMEVRRVPLFEVRQRFPQKGHLVQPDGESDSDMDRRPRERGDFEVVPQSNLASTGVTGAFPGVPTPGVPPLWGPSAGSRIEDYTGTVLLKECWIRGSQRIEVPVIEDGERVEDMVIDVPYWQLICEADGIILTEEATNPFDHGQCPYIRVPYAEMGEFWSIPLCEHLLPAQIALNRLLAAMQQNAELIGNPIFIEPDMSGISRTRIINRPGTRLTANMQAANAIRWLDPPSMPPSVNQLAGWWRDTIDRTSGVSAVTRGQGLRRREAAASVDAVQEASFVRVRSVLRNLEEGLRRAGQQLASNVTQFYLEQRTVPMLGESGSEDYLTLTPKHFWYPDVDGDKITEIPLRFDTWIEAGSSLPISRQARAAEADELFQLGVIDDQEVLSAHGWPNQKQVLERQRAKAAQMAAMQPPGGK